MSGWRFIGASLAWIVAVLAMPFALGALAVTAPTACDELPSAFTNHVTTKTSSVGGGFIADRCTTTNVADGTSESRTIINWSGMFAAIAILALAGFAAAGLAGRLELGRAAAAVGISALVLSGVALAFFL